MRELAVLDRRGRQVAITLIDDADATWAAQWTWRLHRTQRHDYVARYIRERGVPTTIYLHRELLGLPREAADGREADHVNGDSLDNRRENLRATLHVQNMQNQPVRAGGSSRFRGVYWSGRHRKWRAVARPEGRRVSLGYYSDEAEAGRVVSEWRMAHMPFSVESRAVSASLSG